MQDNLKVNGTVSEKKWYVLWSSTDRSIKTIEYVTSYSGVTLWVPTFTYCNKYGDKEQRPIYPQYYFVHCDLATCYDIEKNIKKYRYSGVQFLKDDNNTPIPLFDDEVETMKQVEREYQVDKIVQDERFVVGQEVYIITGPFSNIPGVIVDSKNDKRYVKMTIFGRETMTWVPVDNCKCKE